MKEFLSIILIVYKGIVFFYGWQWLLVPIGVPEVELWHAVGLCIFIQLFTTIHPFAPSLTMFEQGDYLNKFLFEALGYTTVWAIIGSTKFFLMGG